MANPVRWDTSTDRKPGSGALRDRQEGAHHGPRRRRSTDRAGLPRARPRPAGGLGPRAASIGVAPPTLRRRCGQPHVDRHHNLLALSIAGMCKVRDVKLVPVSARSACAEELDRLARQAGWPPLVAMKLTTSPAVLLYVEMSPRTTTPSGALPQRAASTESTATRPPIETPSDAAMQSFLIFMLIPHSSSGPDPVPSSNSTVRLRRALHRQGVRHQPHPVLHDANGPNWLSTASAATATTSLRARHGGAQWLIRS